MSELAEALEIAETIYKDQGTFRFVMLAFWPGERNCRSLKLYKNAEGLYVRRGVRAIRKFYLKTALGARIVDRERLIVVFYE